MPDAGSPQTGEGAGEASAGGDPATPPGEAATGEGDTEPDDEELEPELALHCVLCGSASLRESEHSSFAAFRARAGGATLFTCLDCRHRFAVRLFGHVRGHRHRDTDSQQARDLRIRFRRRLFQWVWIVLAAVLTAIVVYYFLSLDAQRSLTPSGSVRAPGVLTL